MCTNINSLISTRNTLLTPIPRVFIGRPSGRIRQRREAVPLRRRRPASSAPSAPASVRRARVAPSAIVPARGLGVAAHRRAGIASGHSRRRRGGVIPVVLLLLVVVTLRGTVVRGTVAVLHHVTARARVDARLQQPVRPRAEPGTAAAAMTAAPARRCRSGSRRGPSDRVLGATGD